MKDKKKRFIRTFAAFLAITFIYSLIVNIKHYGYDKPVKGKVIYYSIPHCYVLTLPETTTRTSQQTIKHPDSQQ